jgi:hypothetical protein
VAADVCLECASPGHVDRLDYLRGSGWDALLCPRIISMPDEHKRWIGIEDGEAGGGVRAFGKVVA